MENGLRSFANVNQVCVYQFTLRKLNSPKNTSGFREQRFESATEERWSKEKVRKR